MTLQLYEIPEQQQRIHDLLIENDGELTPELEQALAEVQQDAEQRVEWSCKFIRMAEAGALARRVEAAKLGKAAKVLERTAETYRWLIQEFLKAAGHKFIRTPLFKTTRVTRTIPVIEVVNALLVPRECLKTAKPAFSKTLAKAYYDEHGEVPGCSVKFNEHLRIT